MCACQCACAYLVLEQASEVRVESGKDLQGELPEAVYEGCQEHPLLPATVKAGPYHLKHMKLPTTGAFSWGDGQCM